VQQNGQLPAWPGLDNENQDPFRRIENNEAQWSADAKRFVLNSPEVSTSTSQYLGDSGFLQRQLHL
jgi:hypothetical protein